MSSGFVNLGEIGVSSAGVGGVAELEKVADDEEVPNLKRDDPLESSATSWGFPPNSIGGANPTSLDRRASFNCETSSSKSSFPLGLVVLRRLLSDMDHCCKPLRLPDKDLRLRCLSVSGERPKFGVGERFIKVDRLPIRLRKDRISVDRDWGISVASGRSSASGARGIMDTGRGLEMTDRVLAGLSTRRGE